MSSRDDDHGGGRGDGGDDGRGAACDSCGALNESVATQIELVEVGAGEGCRAAGVAGSWRLSGVGPEGEVVCIPDSAVLSADVFVRIAQARSAACHWRILWCEHSATLVSLAPNSGEVRLDASPQSAAEQLITALDRFIAEPISTTGQGVLQSASLITSLLHKLQTHQLEHALAWVLINPPLSKEEKLEHSGPEDFPVSAGGPGSPKYRGGAAEMFARASNLPPRQADRLLSQAGELITRLPNVWQEVKRLEVPMAKAQALASKTMRLSACAVQEVDYELAPHISDVTQAQRDRLICQAEEAHMAQELAERAAAELAFRTVSLDRRNTRSGVVNLFATADAGDGLAFYELITRVGEQLVDSGEVPNLGVGRARALGLIGRGEVAIHHQEGGDDTNVLLKPVQMKLYVHVDRDQLNDQGVAGSAHIEGLAEPVLTEQVARWFSGTNAVIKVTPVIDLEAQYDSTGYQPSPKLREQTILKAPQCVFPGCTRSARLADLDHIVPYDDGGQTTTRNLAPLCRKHHRAKTRRQWEYEEHGDSYQWECLTEFIAAKFIRTPKVRPRWFKGKRVNQQIRPPVQLVTQEEPWRSWWPEQRDGRKLEEPETSAWQESRKLGRPPSQQLKSPERSEPPENSKPPPF